MTIPATAYLAMEEIDAARDKAAALATRYIRRAGWEHTSSTPGSVWMWKKEIEGVTYMVDASDAERIQRELDYRVMNQPHDPVYDAEGACIVCGSSPDYYESPHLTTSENRGKSDAR